mmetsp:Transcript_79030/g.198619  ORF Transcript_79030/g.198619 Transcript_79030/m.198619 type:complete len:90 (-) Transcript_79030:1317-1586(-)
MAATATTGGTTTPCAKRSHALDLESQRLARAMSGYTGSCLPQLGKLIDKIKVRATCSAPATPERGQCTRERSSSERTAPKASEPCLRTS